MGNGQRAMAEGQWLMGNDGWAMADGQWLRGNGRCVLTMDNDNGRFLRKTSTREKSAGLKSFEKKCEKRQPEIIASLFPVHENFFVRKDNQKKLHYCPISTLLPPCSRLVSSCFPSFRLVSSCWKFEIKIIIAPTEKIIKKT